MGWASATYLVRRIVKLCQRTMPDPNERRSFYIEIIEFFEDEDWDTQDEMLGVDPAFDAAMRQIHPDWDWEE